MAERARTRNESATPRRGGRLLAVGVLAVSILAAIPAGGSPVATSSTAAPRCVAVLVDRTGSYPGIQAARRIAAELVSQLRGGDSFQARFVASDSYDPKEILADVTLPPEPPALANQFNARERARRHELDAALVRSKTDLAEKIQSAKIERSGSTDLWGAVAAAAEWRAGLGCTQTTIVTFSDLAHNHRSVPALDLEGIQILVAHFDAGADYAKAQTARERFTAIAEKAGAEVRVVPPGRTPLLRPEGSQ